MKRRAKFCIAMLLGVLILMACSFAFADGFSTNPELINEAAQSVMMLEIHSGSEIIATGSGFVAFDNRHLITNYHVIEGSDMIWAYSDIGDPYIIMNVCILDEEKDIAILQFFSPTDLKPLSLSKTGEVLRASPVVAIGSPKGFKNTVSIGNVSFADREDDISYIQFTAPISNGSSGGALFDDNGDVVGITTFAIQSETGVSQNMNFAINIREAINLYSEWDDKTEKEVFSLAEMAKASINKPVITPTPIPTASPDPTSTPKPTQAPTKAPKATTKPTNTPVPAGTYDFEIQNISHFNGTGNKPALQFTFANNTKDTITSITVSVMFYRNLGKRLSYCGSQVETFDIKIEPGKTATTDWVSFTNGSTKTEYLTASIDSVTVKDEKGKTKEIGKKELEKRGQQEYSRTIK